MSHRNRMSTALVLLHSFGLSVCSGGAGAPQDPGQQGGGGDEILGEKFTPAEVTVAWQSQDGYDSKGITSDKEGVIGIQSDGAGNNLQRDGGIAVYLYKVTLDASMTVTSGVGTKMPSTGEFYKTHGNLLRAPSGALRLVLGADNDFHVVQFPVDSSAASVDQLARPDGTSPFLDDEDYAVYIANGPAGELFLGGTSDVPDMVEFRAITTQTVNLSLESPSVSPTIFTDVMIVGDAGVSMTTTDDGLGVAGEADVDDDDALLIKAAF